jgi:nucleoside-diphosphate-sugar epimerase
MKSIILTGASGFIGRQCIEFLTKKQFVIHAISRSTPLETKENVHWHNVDLSNENEVSEFVVKTKASHLLHFAWITDHGLYWNSLENLKWINYSFNLISKFVEQGGHRVVVAGTCAEYDWSLGYLTENVSELKPATFYGASKKALFDLLFTSPFAKDVSIAWGRIFLLYGPYETEKRIIPYVINSILHKQVAICSSGVKIRDFMFVEDVASAFVSITESNIEGPVNIGSGNPISLDAIVRKIGELMNGYDFIKFDSSMNRNGDPQILYPNTKRLYEEVGWNPSYSVDTALIKTIDWWKQK